MVCYNVSVKFKTILQGGSNMKNVVKKMILVSLMMLVVIASTTSVFAKSKSKYKLSDTKITMKVKTSYTLTLDEKRISGSYPLKNVKIKWSSSNKKVATVKKGVIYTKRTGKATIKAKYKGKTYKCKVTVKKNAKPLKAKSLKEVLNSNGKFKTTKVDTKNSSLSTGAMSNIYGRIPVNIFGSFDVGGASFAIANRNPSTSGTTPLMLINGVRYLVLAPYEEQPSLVGSNCKIKLSGDVIYINEGLQCKHTNSVRMSSNSENIESIIEKDFGKSVNVTCNEYPVYVENESRILHSAGQKCISVYRNSAATVTEILDFKACNLSNGDTFHINLDYRGVKVTIPCICLTNFKLKRYNY